MHIAPTVLAVSSAATVTAEMVVAMKTGQLSLSKLSFAAPSETVQRDM